MSGRPMRVPTTVITGFLGVGKTTAIRALAALQPPDEQWVVLVNELGEVGIDGAILDDGAQSGLAVRELPGGCLCCSGNAPMTATLRQLLATVRPDRLLIEPSGAADAGRVLDILRQDFSAQLSLGAVLTILDPRHLNDERRWRSAAWQRQVEAADVLIGNKVDLCHDGVIRSFLVWADECWPPKQAVLTTTAGRIDPRWLDAPGTGGRSTPEHVHHHFEPEAHTIWEDETGQLDPRQGRRLFRQAWSGPDFATCGWRFEPRCVFDRPRLRQLLSTLIATDGPIPHGAMRVKGLLHHQAGWSLVQADGDGVRWSPTGWRRDSRLEIIAAPAPPPCWSAIDATLSGCLVARAPAATGA